MCDQVREQGCRGCHGCDEFPEPESDRLPDIAKDDFYTIAATMRLLRYSYVQKSVDRDASEVTYLFEGRIGGTTLPRIRLVVDSNG